MIGLGAGAFSAYLAVTIPNGGGVVLGFGIAASSLVFLQFGTQVPVTHHIVLPAAVAAAASGSILWGVIFGIISAFVGEFMANTFCAWGDTHIDPPAATIWPMTSLSILLASIGIYQMVPHLFRNAVRTKLPLPIQIERDHVIPFYLYFF